ncbi:MAG: hypothetical protein Q7U04_00930 [Bacteriovorax sp.]|nr:hypothetical protein [Bacteriovorax sp.]
MAVKVFTKNTYILKGFNYGFSFIVFAWIIIGTILLYDTYRDQHLIFKTKIPIAFYQTSELLGESIGLIYPSDRIKVLRTLFKKDHYVIQVQAANRKQGWILKNNDVDLK